MKSSIKLITLCAVSLICNFNTAQESGKTYYLQNAIVDKYLDVQWAKTANGTPLHLWPYNGKQAQQFALEDAGNNYFYIKSAVADNMYLHVENRSDKPKARPLIWKGKGNDNTKWSFIPASDGFYFIRSKKGTYLEVKDAKKHDGAPIWMWKFNEQKNQQWRFKEVPKKNVYKPEVSLDGLPSNKLEFFKEDVQLAPITNLCPSTLVGGDLEFGGNGPKVFGSVFLYRSDNDKELIARIHFNARETKSDFITGRSEVKGFWEIPVYRAPYGTYINGIVGKPFSQTNFEKVLQGGGQNEIFGGGDGTPHNLTVGNGLDDKGHVALIKLVGDTGGWDISTDSNCKNDTRLLKIVFDTITLELIRQKQ